MYLELLELEFCVFQEVLVLVEKRALSCLRRWKDAQEAVKLEEQKNRLLLEIASLRRQLEPGEDPQEEHEINRMRNMLEAAFDQVTERDRAHSDYFRKKVQETCSFRLLIC